MTKQDKEQRFIEYWENSIQLGRTKYSLINAIILSVALFIIVNLGYYLFTQSSFLGLNMDTFLSFLICYGISFVFYYIPVWNVNSFKYNVMLKRSKKGKKK